MIWTVFLFVQAVLLYVLLAQRSRSKGEPPLDKGVIPWLGHALEFGKDVSKFLNRMKQKHGDIFTVRAAGRYVTVLLDPHAYDEVISDPESLDFNRYAQVLMQRIFHLQLPNHRPAKVKDVMKKHFLGANLLALNAAVGKHLRGALPAEMPRNRTDWTEDGLFGISYRVLFKVGYLTLFGGEANNNNNNTGSDPSRVYEEYRRFEGLLTKLARGTLRAEEKRSALSAQQRLWELLQPAGLVQDSGSSLWLQAYRQLLQEEGADEETQRKAVLMQLWATQGNVGPASFWLLGFLLTNPEALSAVRTEMEALNASSFDRGVTTPVFDSALEETLRLTAAPFITREVVKEKTVHLADGQEFLLRRGDRLCLFPFNSPQMDPQVYHQPQEFRYDRFLNEDGSAKRDFYKAGKKLKYYSLPWGAGSHGCVGRQFAVSTIRQFVYMMISDYDLELCDPDAQMPAVDASRYGFGMLQPEGDLFVRYKYKHNL